MRNHVNFAAGRRRGGAARYAYARVYCACVRVYVCTDFSSGFLPKKKKGEMGKNTVPLAIFLVFLGCASNVVFLELIIKSEVSCPP